MNNARKIIQKLSRQHLSYPPSRKRNGRDFKRFLIVTMLACYLFSPPLSFADGPVSISGKLDLSGVYAFDDDSVKQDPSLIGRIKIDTPPGTWSFHTWLEGGWDGTVKRPPRDEKLFKNYYQVYQSNSPYLEFKELFATRVSGNLDLRAGFQRFAWGRLDEFPPNDLLNPWDYTQFLEKPLEDRKIGVPSLSATLNHGDWIYEAVWVPVLVPYRLPMPDERWAGISPVTMLAGAIPNAEIIPQEPVLPARTADNSNVGLRIRHAGDIEWALNLFHGYDPRPVFKTTSLMIVPSGGNIVIDPGYVPDFHRITAVGFDAAAVKGDWSLRAETAYTFNRYLNINQDLWGYPAVPAPGVYPLNPIEEQHDTLDYGIGADRRLFEDGLLTLQVQQTIIFGNVQDLYEKKIESIIWANLKIGWMNQKVETNINIAYNPEHGDYMTKENIFYVLSDFWKAGITAVAFTGPPQSIFGKYSRNDQLEAEIMYSW
jgi:hypothetical protein